MCTPKLMPDVEVDLSRYVSFVPEVEELAITALVGYAV